MKLSVVIIVKDTREFLQKCLDSIRNQTLHDMEIFVIDDHSSIPSGDIVARYATVLDISYHYLEQTQGPGGARNYGLRCAKGEYICFLDSDDWLDERYVEVLCEAISSSGADMAACRFCKVLEGESVPQNRNSVSSFSSKLYSSLTRAARPSICLRMSVYPQRI